MRPGSLPGSTSAWRTRAGGCPRPAGRRSNNSGGDWTARPFPEPPPALINRTGHMYDAIVQHPCVTSGEPFVRPLHPIAEAAGLRDTVVLGAALEQASCHSYDDS